MMKKILKYLLMIPVILIMIVSCQEILFNDDPESREIMLENFSKIKVNGIFNITLIQDSLNKLVISGKHRISDIEADVNNDTLKIDQKSFSIEPERNSLELHFTTLQYLKTQHPVKLTVKDTIKADFFCYMAIGEIEEVYITIDCNYLIIFGGHNTLGNLFISGKCGYADLSARYGASLDAEGLICKRTEIYNSSAGDIRVNAAEEIKAYIVGTGNIYYRGKPAINLVENTGSGRMIQVH